MQGRTSTGSTHGLGGAMWVRIMTTFRWEEFKVLQGVEFNRHTKINTRKALKIPFLMFSEGTSIDIIVDVGESASNKLFVQNFYYLCLIVGLPGPTSNRKIASLNPG